MPTGKITHKQVQQALLNRSAKLDRIQRQCVYHYDNAPDPDYWAAHTEEGGWLDDIFKKICLTGGRPRPTHHQVAMVVGAAIHLRTLIAVHPLANADWIMIELINAFPEVDDNTEVIRWWKENKGYTWVDYKDSAAQEAITVHEWMYQGMVNQYKTVVGVLLDDMWPNNEIRCEEPY